MFPLQVGLDLIFITKVAFLMDYSKYEHEDSLPVIWCT